MLVALVLVGLLGACGRDDDSDGASGGGADDEILDWTDCMRDQGVELSDPVIEPDGDVTLGDPGSPEDMQAAQEVCGPPPGLTAQDLSGEDQEAFQSSALEFAACMRNEGVDDFPDPDFSDTGPGGQTGNDSDEKVGLSIPFDDIDLEDPAVAAAFEVCQDVLLLPGNVPGAGSADGESDT